MKRGLIVSVLVVIAATVALGFVFVMNASPYETVAAAKSSKHDSIHVVGKIDFDTLTSDHVNRTTRFKMMDETGDLNVVYVGPPKSNLQSATQVVVIGKMEGNAFVAKDMLVKCPSKYESEKGKSGGTRS
jgi:cytochrome c-type biogenesis protein CcmE